MLKTVAIASVTDMSQLMSNTLIQQILREGKHKGNQDSTAALLAKQQKTPDKSPGLKQSQKSKKGKNRPCCTNLKCKKIGHTIETVGPKVVVLRARDQSRLWEHSMDQVHKQKILQRRRMPRPMFYLCKNLLLLPNLIALIQLNGSSTLVPLHTYAQIELGSLPIHSLILHIPFILATSELFTPLVRAKSRLKLIKVLITIMPLSRMSSIALKLE